MIPIYFVFSFPLSEHLNKILIKTLPKYECGFLIKNFSRFRKHIPKTLGLKAGFTCHYLDFSRKSLWPLIWSLIKIQPHSQNKSRKQVLYSVLTGLPVRYSQEIKIYKNPLLRVSESIKCHTAPVQAPGSVQEQYRQALPISRTTHRIS